jgi:hypothetical protein
MAFAFALSGFKIVLDVNLLEMPSLLEPILICVMV